jgi:hypothetical protein
VVRSPAEQELIAHFGEAPATAMLKWGAEHNRTISLPADPWKAVGFTEAFAGSVIVGASRVDEHDRNLVAKVVPAKEGREQQAHLDALTSGAFADDHLVALFGPPIQCSGGQVVFFQEIAGNDHRYKAASNMVDADSASLAALCENVMAGVATEWNPAASRTKTTVDQFVLTELRHPVSGTASVERWAGDLGLGDPAAAWLRTPQDPDPLPNPVLLAYGHPDLRGRTADVLVGHGHGDLHLGNVMVLRDDSGFRPEPYRLIDLSTYAGQAPRGRDEVTLLLSAIAWLWTTVSAQQKDNLLLEITHPERAPHHRQDSVLKRLVAAAFSNFMAIARPAGFAEAWRRQYTLMLMTTALRFTTFSNMPDGLPWWLVRVACHAARAYADLAGVKAPQATEHLLAVDFPDRPKPIMALTPGHPVMSGKGLILGGYSPFDGGDR